jgi:hypothetical protein
MGITVSFYKLAAIGVIKPIVGTFLPRLRAPYATAYALCVEQSPGNYSGIGPRSGYNG